MPMGFNKYRGGKNVRYGFYWNLKEWEAQIIPREGGELKGAANDGFIRLPLLAVLVLAPLMGAAYAFFLPFIGIAMVLMYLAGRLRGLFRTTPPAMDGTLDGTKAGAGADRHAPDHK